MAIVNFYHVEAVMKGIDYHDMEGFLTPSKSITLPKARYIVFCTEKDGDKIVKTITSDAKLMVQRDSDVKGSKMMHQLDFNVWPPHPYFQAKNQMAITKAGTSKAVMGISSVTGEKVPLATCLEAAEGSNLNCTDQPLRTNKVKSVNSVRTSPTKQDYSQAFENQFIEDHDMSRWIKGAPGPEPKRTVSWKERAKRAYNREKKDFEWIKRLYKLVKGGD